MSEKFKSVTVKFWFSQRKTLQKATASSFSQDRPLLYSGQMKLDVFLYLHWSKSTCCRVVSMRNLTRFITEAESEMCVIPNSLCCLHHSADWQKSICVCSNTTCLSKSAFLTAMLSNPRHQCCHGTTDSQLGMALAAEH